MTVCCKKIRWLCAAVLMCGFGLTVHADLVFEKPRVMVSPGLLDEEAKTSFVFKNTGEEPVKITKVQASCGCTTAQATDDTIAPGESAAIDVAFTFGDRYGKQVKRIVLSTDHPKQPRITLTMSTDIPRVALFKPAVLIWRGQDNESERGAKQAKLTLLKDDRVKLIGLGKLPDGLTAQMSQPNPKKKPLEWAITVNADAVEKGGNLTVPVKLKVNGKKVERLLRVRVIGKPVETAAGHKHGE